MTTAPQTYRPAQITLHWVVFGAIWVQWLFNEPMKQTVAAIQTGASPASSDLIMAWVHVGFGTTILLATLARLYLRYRFGTPRHAPGTSHMQAKIAEWMHRALYATLIVMALTGGLTWNGVADLSYVHWALNILLFALISVHAAAALFNQFIRKDGTLRRMIPSRKNHKSVLSLSEAGK